MELAKRLREETGVDILGAARLVEALQIEGISDEDEAVAKATALLREGVNPEMYLLQANVARIDRAILSLSNTVELLQQLFQGGQE